MFKRIFLFIFLCTLVFANEQNPYLVENIEVRYTEENATKAREVAIEQAEYTAIRRVMRNLSINETNVALISKNDISTTIKSMKIRDERITFNSYKAIIDIEFNQEYLLFLFNKYKITRYTPTLNSYLIISHFVVDKKDYLFEPQNGSLGFLKKYSKGANNIFFIKNDFLTKKNLEKISKTSINFYKYEELANYYNVNNLVFVFTTKRGNQFVNDVVITNKNRTETLNQNDYTDESLEFISSNVIGYIRSLNTEKVDNALTSGEYEGEDSDIIRLFIRMSSLKEFIEIDKILSYIGTISSKELKSIDKKAAMYYIKPVNGDVDSFLQSLRNNNFVISQRSDGVHVYLQ
ncbi:MAG: hypothetical protein LBH46_03615 [Rickettsiales bacterium]|jgi:hypothetical protein|nr:hypothetical protein [Rickettsiales bacterium]